MDELECLIFTRSLPFIGGLTAGATKGWQREPTQEEKLTVTRSGKAKQMIDFNENILAAAEGGRAARHNRAVEELGNTTKEYLTRAENRCEELRDSRNYRDRHVPLFLRC